MDWITRLESATGDFARLLETGRLDARVPSCPDWDLQGLAEHLGGVHRWAAHAIIEGTPDGTSEPAPAERVALVSWYRASVGLLLETLISASDDAPAWGFGPKPRTVAFWHRRQLHETTMHLWDGLNSQGTVPVIAEDVARDGLDEVAGIFFPRQVRLGRIEPLRRSLALRTAADPGVVLAGDGTGTAPENPDATVEGPAEALLLLVWRRTGLEDPRLTVTGDAEAARAVLSVGIVP